MTAFKLLSIDGGGIFGSTVTELMKDKPAYNDFDAFAGTSIGSVIAAWAAMGRSMEELDGIFDDAMNQIFSRSWYDVGRRCGLKAKWPTKNLTTFLTKYFDVPFSSIQKPLYVTTVDRILCRPKVYSSCDLRDADVSLSTALRHSVSAPTYFATGRYLDGGLFANDPSTVLACGIHKHLDISYDAMNMLAVGTGYFPKKDITEKDDAEATDGWSLVSWASPVISTLLDINVTGFEFLTSQLDLNVYEKFNGIVLDDGWDMDDTSLIPSVRVRTAAIKSDFDVVYKKVVG